MAKNPESLEEYIMLFYNKYLALYGDEELASVAAAASINEILGDRARTKEQENPTTVPLHQIESEPVSMFC